MRALSPLVIAVCLLAGRAAAQDDPLAAALAARPGMREAKRYSGELPMGPAVAVLLEGESSSELDTFVSLKGRYLMIDTQTAGPGGLAFEPKARPFDDPWPTGDTAATVPTLVFHKHDSLGEPMLAVLRYKRPYFEKIGEFPLGELFDVDGDGRLDVVSRQRPLGRFFGAECGNFSVTPGNAFDTAVYYYFGSRFAPDPKRSKRYLQKRLNADEAAFAAAEASRSDDPGAYLGRALTVYFGRVKLGRPDEAWAAVERATAPPAIAPPGLSACLSEVRAQLRAKLGVKN